MNSFKKYKETKLPNKEMFYNELNNKHCSIEDYANAKLVYNKMECKNSGNHTDIYIINYVLILAYVFKTFRKTCMNYQLKRYIKEINKIGRGCILEVDLKYLSKIHDKHNDFPFCPQNTRINQQKVSKLINTLFDKENFDKQIIFYCY